MIEVAQEQEAQGLLAKFAQDKRFKILKPSEGQADLVLNPQEGEQYSIWRRTQYTPEEHSILIETWPEQDNGGLDPIEELSEKIEEELKETDPRATVVVLRLNQSPGDWYV